MFSTDRTSNGTATTSWFQNTVAGTPPVGNIARVQFRAVCPSRPGQKTLIPAVESVVKTIWRRMIGKRWASLGEQSPRVTTQVLSFLKSQPNPLNRTRPRHIIDVRAYWM